MMMTCGIKKNGEEIFRSFILFKGKLGKEGRRERRREGNNEEKIM
jgi:hypothetical protein